MRLALLVALAACKPGTRAASSETFDAAAVHDAVVSAPDAGPRSQVARLVDAFEHEHDPKARADLAVELGREDAVAGGVQSRVIGLVRAYVAIPGGDAMASDLLMSLVKGDHPPPRAVGDLVLELAEHGGDHTKFVSFYAVTKMTDRFADVCPVMAMLAPTDLHEVVTVIARTRDACVDHLDPVIDAIVARMEAEQFEAEHYITTKVMLQQTRLTPDQLDRLAAGARKARRHITRHLEKYANDLRRQLDRLR